MKLTIYEDVFRISEPLTISYRSRSEAHFLTLEATCMGLNELKGLGESIPYGRYRGKLQSVKAQNKILPNTFTGHELQDLLPTGRARKAMGCAL